MASDRNTRWAHRLIPLLLFTMGLADGGWSGEGRGNLVREVFQVKAPKDKPSLVFSEASQLRVALHQSAPPKADGVLNDACWSTASAVALLDGGARPLASEPSAALLYFGADALHIAFICPLAAGTEELSESRRRDHLVWKDESIEVFVDPGRTRERYYQFILNTLNTQQDGEGWQGKWSGEWRSGAVVTGQPSGGKGLPEALKARKDLAFIRGAKRFWACELSIPYAIIGATRPKVGDIWGLNLCRNDKRRGEGRVWSRIKRSNHEPSSFGEIRFVDEAPLARIGPYWNAPAPVTGNNVFRFFVAGGSARAGEFEVRARLSRPGGQEQALPVRTAAVNRMASLAIPLQQVGRYRLALALKDTKSGKVVAEKSMLFDLSPPPRALRVKLDQKVYYASEKVLCADVVLGENTGAKYGEVAFRLCGDDGKPLRQGKVAAPSKAFQVEMDIRGLAPGKYSLSTTFSGKAGGPPLRIFIMDEPGGHPDNLKETVYYNKLVKKKFPHLKTWVTIGGGLAMGIDEIGLLGPGIDEFSTNRFNVDILKRLLKRKKTYGVYNGGSSAEAVGGCRRDRYMFGFYGWKTGAGEMLQWVYAFGAPWKEPIRGNNGYTYPAADGPLPSIPWEAIREGLDDYRYTDLLWRLITVARKSDNAKAKAAAEAGAKTALAIMGAIDFNYQSPDRSSSTPAASPASMEKWRWQTASACLELLKHVPLEKALATPAKRPGPLEMPFPKVKAAKLKMGPELLPNGGFENALEPWKGSRNKFAKAGTSAVDSTEHHGGGKSFKLTNPGGVGGQAVNVCVWGWGGPGPSMTLEAGKTYEFSAWIKSRGAKPRLKLALPGKALAGQSRNAAAADAAGWSRQSLRVTMKKAAKPGYLAVWLQGAGTAWCDDLSLREVKTPPFVLETGQRLVDDSDRGVAVRVRRTGGAKPIRVTLQLPGAKGEKRTLTVAPNGSAEFEFNGAELRPGENKLSAELEGGDFRRTLSFQRILGAFEK